MTESNHDDAWRRLFHKARACEDHELGERHPEWGPTPQCPPLPMFLRIHRGGEWDRAYRDHFATGCLYCERQLRLAAKLEARTTTTVVFVLVRGRPTVGAARRGDPNPITAIPAGELRWHLEPAPPDRIDTDDGPAFPLPDEIARRSYDLPEGVAVKLRIDLLLEPGPRPNTFTPTLEARPGPHKGKEPLRLTLRFAEDCVREFVVRPHALFNKVSLRSDTVEALPAAVVEGWTTAGGPVSLEAAFPGDSLEETR